MVRQNTAVHNGRVNSRTVNTLDVKGNQAIVEQQNIARFDVFMQGIQRDTNPFDVAVHKAQCAVEEKFAAIGQ